MATGESITRFFERLGFELRNSRMYWGATNGDSVMLWSWGDEVRANPWRVCVFNNLPRKEKAQRIGRAERKTHLLAAWAGGIPIYTVLVTPKLGTKGDRQIGNFRTDAVFPIERFIEEDDSIYAVYGKPIEVEKLREHIGTYSIAPKGSAPPRALLEVKGYIPTDTSEKAAYLAAETREVLIEAAKAGKKVTYGELFDEFDLNRMTVGPVLGVVGHECLGRNEPILTALVVNKTGELKGRCGPGFKKEFKLDEDEERVRVFTHWGAPSVNADAPPRVEWTDEELKASVASYREMMHLDASGVAYVKAHYYRQLADRFNRGEGAFERRMQNISHLLDSRGLEWLQGLKPQENVGANVEPRLLAFLDELITELTTPLALPEEIADLKGVVEGAKKQIVVNAYERDPSAKPRCIKKWGCACLACGFDFGAVYGELGKGFIHVHHLKPIHTIGEAYVLDPEEDLRPVCPNCHSMLHRTKEVISIEELISLLKLRFDNGFQEINLGSQSIHEDT